MASRKMITGACIAPAFTSVPPAPPGTFLGVAGQLLAGVEVLAAASPASAFSLAFLSGQVLECLLKAYLSKFYSEDELKKEFCHELSDLRAEAVKRGFPESGLQARWVECLSELHGWPFPLRYARAKTKDRRAKETEAKKRGEKVPRAKKDDTRCVNAFRLINAEPMVTDLKRLLEFVRKQTK